ncbi:unnamed protein product [Miscanthus lutarioriparius]|uniref:BZIP domain-containing protein n=1 Tax=Miscanthus lutarioriparius TaxID=422564 RepID=A0A811Q0E0_9POAL|nr:unnamed protein product [Miscanthus lutarioriparius]
MAFSFAPADQYQYRYHTMKQSSSSAAAAGDSRRQRRMIKNRESAARSRAQRQAYTNELELELAQLRRENEMLIKHHQELNPLVLHVCYLLLVRLAMSSSAQVPAHMPLRTTLNLKTSK